jgi:EAL domain-containing protein (putative c-di-GMP-specific phosphodiesterase class I)
MVQTVLAALAAGPGAVEQILELARRHLDMEVAFIAQFSDGRQLFRAVDGDSESFGIRLQDGPPLAETFCQLMVSGEIANLIPGAADHPRVRNLPTRRRSRIGSYIGVPLRLSDGTLYGSFCCLSHQAGTDLDQRDVRFLQMLAGLLVRNLDIEANEQRERDEIRAIIDHEDVCIAVQPIVRLHDQRCVGMEALARFPGVGTPDEVFAAAHRGALGASLERMTARRALTLVLPLLGPDQYLAVNMSPAVACEVGRTLDPDTLIGRDRLVLEITEHAEVDSYEELSNVLLPLRERGLRLAIDDVGAGYASMRHVIELQPDIIKIDRSLVHDLAADGARRRVISSLVLLGLDLDATVVAEGVERVEDLEGLRDLGVDAAQGYLIARPTVHLGEATRWSTKALLPAQAAQLPL